MIKRKYTVEELKRTLTESVNTLNTMSGKNVLRENNEFEPVLGKNVQRDNKKNNQDAYDDMEKNVKDYDGGARTQKKTVNYPQKDGRGQENIEYDSINEPFKKRIKSQLKGYVDDKAEELHKNDPYGNADFDTIKGIDDNAKEIKKGRDVAKEIGLTSREINKKDFEKQKELAVENKTVRLKFKNTTFLTENHMISRIPDTFKVEGKKFIMQDKANNEYLVEWHTEEDPKITNKTRINEEQNRIKELFNYKRGTSNTTNTLRLTEDKKVNDMLDKARKLMK